MHTTYLLLGGNIGDRLSYLEQGILAIEKTGGNVIKRSAVYETAAWGKENQQPFLNVALEIKTMKSPTDLLKATAAIEASLGRQREEHWGARTLDIDLLFYEDAIIDLPELKIPHPFLHERRFALTPMAEIAPVFYHPILHKTIQVLLEECPDPLPVKVLAE